MKQWIIDRYNKGQDKYFFEKYFEEGLSDLVFLNSPLVNIMRLEDNERMDISLYDFLFNPKWGFAKAFWGEERVDDCNGYTTTVGRWKAWEKYLQQMAISENLFEYLEQFKEVAE